MLQERFFPSQNQDEKIVMLLRRHWFILFIIAFKYFLATLLPVVFYFLYQFFSPGMLSCQAEKPIFILLASTFYFFWLFMAFHNFIDYWLDVWIVTDRRIVNIEQKGLFFRTISEQKLFRVQDVTADVKGLIPTFLHYGDVHIQTAGTYERFVFKEVPHPYEVTKKIMQLVEWRKRNLSPADLTSLNQPESIKKNQ